MDKSVTKSSSEFISKDGSEWGEAKQWYWEGIRCHWRVLGRDNQKPLLLLHGFGASSSHWRHNAAPLAASGFCVYGLDLIGFGESEQPSQKKVPKLDNQIWAEQVAAFLEQVVKTREHGAAVIIGNSLGSLIALTTLFFKPELVSAVIASPLPDPALMQPTISSRTLWWGEIRNFLVKIFFHILPLEILVPLVSRTVIIKTALQAAYHSSIKSDKELQRLITKPAKKKTAARVLRSMCIGMATRKREITAPVLLSQISRRSTHSPILLLWGRQDNLVPLMIGKQLVKIHPWLDLFVIDETGHCPHDESPIQFNQIVLNWLATSLVVDQKQA